MAPPARGAALARRQRGTGSGAGAKPARPPAPAASDDEGASDLITGGACYDQPTSPTVKETLPDGGRA